MASIENGMQVGDDHPEERALATANSSLTSEITEDSGVGDQQLGAMQSDMERVQGLFSFSGNSTFLGSVAAFPTDEEKIETDSRSVYVGNVDYGSTAHELRGYFSGCGHVKRVTILANKLTGQPKGYAYIEFLNKSSVAMAVGLDGSLFRLRPIKVSPKRTNRPGLSTTNRGRGRGRGAYLAGAGAGAVGGVGAGAVGGVGAVANQAFGNEFVPQAAGFPAGFTPGFMVGYPGNGGGYATHPMGGFGVPASYGSWYPPNSGNPTS